MKKTMFYLVGGLSIAGIGYVVYRIATSDKTSSYDWVIKKGAKPYNENGIEGARFSTYNFFPNNRVGDTVNKKMGTFNKKSILWDDGSRTEMKTIFNV